MNGRGEGCDDDRADILKRHLPISFHAFASELAVLTGKRAVRGIYADDVVGQKGGGVRGNREMITANSFSEIRKCISGLIVGGFRHRVGNKRFAV